MENTCKPENCQLYKFLKLKDPTKCFNYIESWWKPENKKEPILIKDCAPKRTFIMIQELHNRFIGIAMGKDYLKHKQLTNKSKKLEK